MKLRDVPCKCGWKFLGFHICIDLSSPEPTAPKSHKKRFHEMSPAQKAAWDESQKLRWQEHHDKHRDRDAKIVERYNEGNVGYRALSEEFGCAHTTIQRVLKNAELAGQTVIRKRGKTLVKGAK